MIIIHSAFPGKSRNQVGPHKAITQEMHVLVFFFGDGFTSFYLGNLDDFSQEEVDEFAAAHGQVIRCKHPLWKRLILDNDDCDDDDSFFDKRLVQIIPKDFVSLPKIQYVLEFQD